MTAVWFTSDLHLKHPLVAVDRANRHGFTHDWASYPDDGSAEAACVAWHDRTLAENWDALVHPKDQVWVLGDLTAGGGLEATAYALNWIADRPGEKHLIPGNHCPVHPMHRDAHTWQRAYLQVFASVQAFARRKIGQQRVLLSHFPYEYDSTMEERYTQYRLPDEGLPIVHGHTHSVWRCTTSPALRRDAALRANQFHVGVDAWDMKPVKLEQLSELISKAGW